MAEIEYPWKEISVSFPVSDPELIEAAKREERYWRERMERELATNLFEEKPHGRVG